MLTTLNEFIRRVETLNEIQNAYDVFEYECSSALRDVIYDMADVSEAEPFRAAMHNLGFDSY
jgi:hypothetical protein